MQQCKRMLSLALALVMILGLLPTVAFAHSVSRETDLAPAEAAPASVEAERGGGDGGILWMCSFFDAFKDYLGWQIIDANNDGYSFGPDYENEEGFVRSDWMREDTSSTRVAADDYLISPRIELPDEDLEYTLGIQGGGILNGGYNADCEIYVYTGKTLLRPDNLYSLLDHPYRFHCYFWEDWQWDYMDLSAYAGQTIQLVFRHCNSDQSVLKINQVHVSWQEPDEQVSKVTALNVPMPEVGVNVDDLRESDITFPDYAGYDLVPGSLVYYREVGEDAEEMHDEVFDQWDSYSFSFRVRPRAGYTVSDTVRASYNGKWAQADYYPNDGEIQISCFNLPSLEPSTVLREINLRVAPPAVGAAPATTAERWLENDSTDYHYTVTDVNWFPNPRTFDSDTAYSVTVDFLSDSGYVTSGYTHYTINGQPAEHYAHSTSDGQCVELCFEENRGETIDEAEIWLTLPVDGEIPTDAWSSDSRYYTQWSYWYPLNSFGEVQNYLSREDVAEGGCVYRYYFGVRANEGYSFDRLTRVLLNGEEAMFAGCTDDCWYYWVDVTARSKEPVTLTFNAHGHGVAPDPIQIPYGSSIWSGVSDLNLLQLPDTDGMVFSGWSNYASDRKDETIDLLEPIYEDTKLYAVWLEEIDSLDLWVDQPIVGNTPDKPTATVEKYTGCTVYPVGWYNTANGYYSQDFVTEDFEAGKTYYGAVKIEPDNWSVFAETENIITVHGATKVSEENSDGPLIVTFSVTIPQDGTVNTVDLWTDTPVPGSSVDMAPTRCCLTPGVDMFTDGWWDNLEDLGDIEKLMTGGFAPGKTYYTSALLGCTGSAGFAANPQIRCSGSAELYSVKSIEGFPLISIDLKMTVPDCHGLCVTTDGNGWFFLDDNPHAKSFMDGAFVPAGRHTLTAKADPGWYFVGWYDETGTLLTTSTAYTFDLDREVDGWYALFSQGDGMITITFNSHGYGVPPEPVQVPRGVALWSYLNPDHYRLPDNDKCVFFGWSTGTRDWAKDVIGNLEEFDESTTLYALWLERLDNMILYVDPPAAGETASKPVIGLPHEPNFEVEPLGWWTTPDGFEQDREPFVGTFSRGATYYATVCLKPDVCSIFAESSDLVTVLGAQEISETRMYDDELYATFSVTIPQQKAIDELSLYVDIGWPGWLSYGINPTQICLTPGVTLNKGSWWANLEDVGDPSKALTGRFPTGCPLYTDLLAIPDAGCTMDPSSLSVSIQGGGTLIRTEAAITTAGVHVIYSVYSPAYCGLDFLAEGDGWIFIDDDPHGFRYYEAPFFEAGPHIVRAVPDPGWHFNAWYNDEQYMNNEPVTLYNNNHNYDFSITLTASFYEGTVPIDVVDFELPIPAAGDSFTWSTESAGARVVNGAPVTITESYWYTEGGISGDPLSFELGKKYFAEIHMTEQPGYKITDDTVFRINGEEVPWKQHSNVTTWTVASRNYTMEAAEQIPSMDVNIRYIPGAGECFNPAYDVVNATTMAQIQWISALWCEADGSTSYPLIFQHGGQYYAYFEVHGQPGWQLTDDTVVTICGEPAFSWTPLGAGRYGLTSKLFTVHEEMVIPTVQVYMNNLIVETGPMDPYIPDYMPYYVEDWTWTDANGNPLPKEFTPVGGAEYGLTILVAPLEGYMFSADELTVTPFWETSEVVSVEPHRLTLHGTCTAIKQNPFVDVKSGKYYYDAVMWAFYHQPYQITKGTDDTHFSPNQTCSRAQVVSFLWNALDRPEPDTADNPFVDIKEGKYYYKAVLWAYQNGITKGADATHFDPNGDCNRAQVVTFLWNANRRPEPKSQDNPFTDVKAGKYYYKAVLWAVEQGITKGTDSTHFSPNQTCTRAQVVTFLYNAYGPKG